MIANEPGFAHCLAAVLGLDPDRLPAVDGDPAVFWRQWLAGRNLGLVPVDGAASFSWPGFWIAAVEREGGGGAVLMFGVPSGVILDPESAASAPFEIVAGVVVAPLDLDLDRAQPYGSPRPASGVVEALLLAPDAEVPLVRVEEAEAVAGRGLTGDRYAAGRGTFSGRGRGGELTLIEAEALEALAADGHHGRLGAGAAQCRHARHRPQRARRPSLSDRWCRVRRPQARRTVRPSATPGSSRCPARTRASRRLARGPARERHDSRG